MNNPYLQIWYNPSKTIDAVLSKQVKFNYHLPILISAISTALEIYVNDIGDLLGIGQIGSLIILIISTSIFYLIFAYFFPWFILMSGRILKGKSNFDNLQIIIGLTCIPIIITLTYQLLGLLFSRELMSNPQVNYSIKFIVWILYIRILIIGISKTQKFSFGFAIVNLFLAIFPLIVIRLILN